MSYFHRLTDIVTCSLTEILAQQDDPRAALRQIIHEMEEGLSGARRSVNTAIANTERLTRELAEAQEQIASWTDKARTELAAGREDAARLALLRKTETEDVLAGLRQQEQAAIATRNHLTTTLRAIEARLADARRRLSDLEAGQSPAEAAAEEPATPPGTTPGDARARQIEDELAALKKELGRG